MTHAEIVIVFSNMPRADQKRVTSKVLDILAFSNIHVSRMALYQWRNTLEPKSKLNTVYCRAFTTAMAEVFKSELQPTQF